MTTKGEIALEAYDSLGIGGNLESDMIMRGVKNLQRMMLSWENDGVLIGYKTSDLDPAPDDDSGIADHNLQAVVLNLACQLGRVLRMPVDGLMQAHAETAYKNLLPIIPPSIAANPYMPLGQGNNWCMPGYDGPKYQAQDDDNIATENQTDLLVEP